MGATGFADSYALARARFQKVAEAGGWALKSYPLAGFEKDGLAADVAYGGNDSPRKLLVIVSGIHGVELMAGSGCQVNLMKSDVLTGLPDEFGVMLVHAINPWGAAHLRRANEHNVDVCRNGPDFNGELPENQGYAALDTLLRQPDNDQLLLRLRGQMDATGPAAVVGALMAGQYTHPSGFNFGGNAPSWSISLLESLIRKHSRNTEHSAVIELHSGLGDYAAGMVVCMQRDPALARARRWFGGNVVSPFADQNPNASGPLHRPVGHTSAAFERAAVSGEVTAITVEFGTYAMQQNFEALIQDHWLWCVAKAPGEEVVEGIKQKMLRAHLPDDRKWEAAVTDSCEAVTRQALAGLTGGDSDV